jgi:release factor glutamine methyltransferase
VTGGVGAQAARSATEPLTVLSVMLQSADYLAGKGIDTARLDAEYMLAHTMGVGRLEMYMQHERPMEPAELDRFRPLLKRRGQREPLQYILGRQSFRELELAVGPGVLIPRPETEQLVGVVLAWAEDAEDLSALDIGTGTGAIALSLLTEGPFAACVGVDASPDALDFARRNRDAIELTSRLELRLGSLLGPIEEGERFDVVVSNPPYVAETERQDLQPEVLDWEPPEALFAGDDGLDVLRDLVPAAAPVLRQGGLLALEVGDGQAEAVVELIERTELYETARIHDDLAGKRRIVTALRTRT